MAENKSALLTESFELVVGDFYNAVEAASLVEKPTSNTFEIETIARAIVDSFKSSVSLTESGEEKEVSEVSSINDEPVIVSVDEMETLDAINRVSSGAIVVVVESPESPPPDSSLHQSPDLSPVPEDWSKDSKIFKSERILHPDVETKDALETNHHANRDTWNYLYLRTWNPSHFIDFEWALENFSQYMEEVHSYKFSAQNCENIWQASIFISKNEEGNVECLELHMAAMFEFKRAINAHFDLGVYNKKGESFHECVTMVKFTEDRRKCQCLIAKDLYAKSTGNKFKIYNDEIIIKGRIKLTCCCLMTQRFDEAKLETI